MSNATKNKNSGKAFERRVVAKAREAGLPAERAWGSDGRALGYHERVDITIDDWLIQCKHRQRIADYLKPDDDVDAQVVGDRSGAYVVMRLERFLEFIV